MTIVKFYDKSFVPSGKLKYSIICARYKGDWIFVRNYLRDTWELCGGHIEEGESSDEAARRELMEETGAIIFDLERVATYSVEKDGRTGYARLYFAEVKVIGQIPDNKEIAEMKITDRLPENLTYPDIQPILFRKTISYLENRAE